MVPSYVYIIQFFFVSIFGTIFHFTYDITRHNFVFSIISAVNESTWEHLKMGLFPYFIWLIFKASVLVEANSIFANFAALMIFILSISTVFYSYKYFTKKAILPVDISNFYQGIFTSTFVESVLQEVEILHSQPFQVIGTVGFLFVLLCAMTWTYFPPIFFLVQDPVTKKYGIEGHCKCKLLKYETKKLK